MSTWLFVPGDRPDRFAKAVASGAREVIVDLEDAVAPERKESARGEVARWLAGGGAAWVRVNAAGTPWHEDDLGALRESHGLRGVVLPKAQAAAVREVRRALPETGILALVESAAGIQDAPAVASCNGVSGLAFGSIDFALDVGSDESDEALLFARGALVVASRAAGLPPPIDGVTVETRDLERGRAAAVRARRLGFGGKLCVHPAQVETIEQAFAPDPAEVDWARSVLTAAAGQDGPFTLDGRMVDEPVLAKARRILHVAR